MLSVLLDRVTQVLKRDEPRLMHPADFLTQPLLVFIPIAAAGFVWAQDYLGASILCNPKEDDSFRTVDFVNTICSGSMSNMTSLKEVKGYYGDIVTINQSRKYLIILILQAVLLRGLFISWWGMLVGEDILLSIKSWTEYCSDIAKGLEDWYQDIWPDDSKEGADPKKANVKLYRVQLLVNDAQDMLETWLETHASTLYLNFLAYSVVSGGLCLLFGWASGIMCVVMLSPQFPCHAIGEVYQCVDRNAQLIDAVVYFNSLFTFAMVGFMVWTVFSSVRDTDLEELFFCQYIPGMSEKSFKERLRNAQKSDFNWQYEYLKFLSKYFPRHQYLGLALLSKYMDMNRFTFDRLPYLERYTRLTKDKDVLSLRETYSEKASGIHQKQE